jgi:hypothetical protein
MQPLDPPLTSALASLAAVLLMVHAGIGKRLLSWRPAAKRAPRPRRQKRIRG